MKSTKRTSWKIAQGVISLGFPLVCVKLAFLTEKSWFDFAPVLLLIIGIVVGTYTAVSLVEDPSTRAIIGILYAPAMLYLMFIVGDHIQAANLQSINN